MGSLTWTCGGPNGQQCYKCGATLEQVLNSGPPCGIPLQDTAELEKEAEERRATETYLTQQCVKHIDGRTGLVVQRIGSEVYKIVFGMMRTDMTAETVVAENIRSCSSSEIMAWRFAQGFHGEAARINGHI